MEQQKTTVIIVGAGPAGLATSACLNLHNIPNIVLEREDCSASLWRKRAYGRLKLHLAKEFCELPHFPFPPNTPTYVPKNAFIQYLDDYVAHFQIDPLYNQRVDSASYDAGSQTWVVQVVDAQSGVTSTWVAEILVVATGENSEGYVPPLPGLGSFFGDVIHSSSYVDGDRFKGKNILVVGCGNSGMEIALDLSNWGANAAIVIRSPVHVLNEWMVRLGMVLLKYFPLNLVDNILVNLANWKFGELSDYGITRPSKGPFFVKKTTGRSPVIDVGTVAKIKQKKIEVVPAIHKVKEDHVKFTDGTSKNYDVILFATGYRSTVGKWLRDEEMWLFGADGMPRRRAPDHWKGENGLYCAGFARNGLWGINQDAKAIAKDIAAAFNNNIYN